MLWGSIARVSGRLTSAAFLIHPLPAPSGLVVGRDRGEATRLVVRGHGRFAGGSKGRGRCEEEKNRR